VRRLPKFIRIAGLKHGIGKVRDLSIESDDGVSDSHLHRCYGTFEPGGPLIWLDADNGPERDKATLVHEVLHAIVSTAHIDMDDETEETLVSRMAPLMLDFIRANRGAVLYLQES
jgi:Zn-dependent peptidase ImmA (M78 family)